MVLCSHPQYPMWLCTWLLHFALRDTPFWTCAYQRLQSSGLKTNKLNCVHTGTRFPLLCPKTKSNRPCSDSARLLEKRVWSRNIWVPSSVYRTGYTLPKELSRELPTLGSWEPVPGYSWHKMVLCSPFEYLICNCIHNYAILNLFWIRARTK